MAEAAPQQPELAGRAPWLRPSDLDDAQRRVYDAISGGPRAASGRLTPLADDQGRFYGPFNAMLLSPAVGLALQDLGAVIRYGAGLSDRAREIAILEVAGHSQSEFEWYAHSRLGVAAGLTAAEVDAIRTGAELELPVGESVVRQVAVALVESDDLDDELFARADQELGAAVLMELIALVGYYQLLAVSLRVWRTPLPAGIAPVFTGLSGEVSSV